jgi:2-keto-4-pentenoate hydratase
MDESTKAAIADALIDAYDRARTIEPITTSRDDFDVDAAYDVLHAIETRRRAQGWQSCGRKIGFTNRTIWPRYGVYQPMWAHVWTRTVHRARAGRASLALAGLVQPRIEPEVVFRLRASVPVEGGARDVLECVEWIAPGFEIVQSHFPGWKFKAADCTAAFGLHGALVIGEEMVLDAKMRDTLAAMLPAFELTLSRESDIVDRGRGSNVLDSPALALQHLARVLAHQPQFAPLAAGEAITTGTVTDAWPVERGQTWRSDYGALDLPGLTLSLV